MSVKFQITVAESVIAEWKHAAEVAGISVAELIRQTMTDRLRSNAQRNRTDPFEAITDLVDSAETDLAGSVDEVLYR
jgi:hypothetical protein